MRRIEVDQSYYSIELSKKKVTKDYIFVCEANLVHGTSVSGVTWTPRVPYGFIKSKIEILETTKDEKFLLVLTESSGLYVFEISSGLFVRTIQGHIHRLAVSDKYLFLSAGRQIYTFLLSEVLSERDMPMHLDKAKKTKNLGGYIIHISHVDRLDVLMVRFQSHPEDILFFKLSNGTVEDETYKEVVLSNDIAQNYKYPIPCKRNPGIFHVAASKKRFWSFAIDYVSGAPINTLSVKETASLFSTPKYSHIADVSFDGKKFICGTALDGYWLFDAEKEEGIKLPIRKGYGHDLTFLKDSATTISYIDGDSLYLIELKPLIVKSHSRSQVVLFIDGTFQWMTGTIMPKSTCSIAPDSRSVTFDVLKTIPLYHPPIPFEHKRFKTYVSLNPEEELPIDNSRFFFQIEELVTLSTQDIQEAQEWKEAIDAVAANLALPETFRCNKGGSLIVKRRFDFLMTLSHHRKMTQKRALMPRILFELVADYLFDQQK